MRRARGLIFAVLFLNVQCAVLFLAQPQVYAPAFELSGEVGAAAVRGYGVLFLMWNVPYALACWQPRRFRAALACAVIMQALGAAGETWIWFSLSAAHAVLRSSIWRFMLFDTAGLLCLGAALYLTHSLPAPRRA